MLVTRNLFFPVLKNVYISVISILHIFKVRPTEPLNIYNFPLTLKLTKVFFIQFDCDYK